MTNEEIVRKLVELDEKIEVKQKSLDLLKTERHLLKLQIKADNVEIEEYEIKQKILKEK